MENDNEIITVGVLIEKLQQFDNNMPILCYGYESDGYEVASNVELDYSDCGNHIQGVVITPKSRW
jgi:hypothetical protein